MNSVASRLRDGLDAAATYVDQKAGYAFERAPRTMPLLYIEVIKGCNLRCKMCNYPTDYPTRGRLLSTEDLTTIFEQSLTLGTRLVSFSGGEPFGRHDILDLIATTGRLGLKQHINTNGTQIDDDVARSLAGAGHLMLTVSLDHPDPEVNDEIRGEEVWALVARAVRSLRRYAPDVMLGLNCVVGRHVQGQLDRMVDLAARWGISAIKFLPLHTNLAHRWGNADGANDLRCAQDEIAALGDELLAAADRARGLGLSTSSRAFLRGIPEYLSGTLRFPCYAGYVYGNIDPYGFLFPCYDHMEPLDVRKRGIVEAWRSPEMDRMRAKVRGCDNPCWNSGNAEPSIRMSVRGVLGDPGQILHDVGLYRL